MENKRSALFVCVSVGLAFLAVVGAAWSADKELEIEKIAVKFEREVERGGYRVVTTQELKGWIDQKKDMLIVDTLPPDNFKKQHIPGAVNFEIQRPELTQMSDKMRAELEKLLGPDKDRTIVFYCGFTDCERSHNGPCGPRSSAIRTLTGSLAASRDGLKQATRLKSDSGSPPPAGPCLSHLNGVTPTCFGPLV